ncbi:uncharacterized protein PGTG_21007 [Puccinia graminis f. sp. tritici CRL 75-36-700-3]|uniref:Uncharacterized protein n=1 Tax=Puccinia graminis f. sp. tritici (strain CRL 75-36-700-3 / race SCCL) TaxID=418459 RepID=H6QQ55_PUCGT|nr:uncharacterized protein PGTG_21007 [Puccinia graminis f. sp. tritici CRL 75-36-700-3]EHS64656.1 hypothetical protein PGTG_21007 [Puccinia graminis f. sp. tritici CRL 75-36-700-3]
MQIRIGRQPRGLQLRNAGQYSKLEGGLMLRQARTDWIGATGEASVCAGLCWTDDKHNYGQQEERTKFKAEKSDLILQHTEQIKSMDSRHEDQINNLKAKHKEILVASLTELDLRRTRKFESNLSALQEKHLAEINEIKLDHQKQIKAITANPETSGGPKSGTPDGDSMITYPSELAKIKSSYEEKIEMLKLQHQTDLNALEEKFLMSSLSADLRKEQQANQRKINLLTDELGE